MPIAKLEFSLPDEKVEFEMALKGATAFRILFEFRRLLGDRLDHQELSPDERKALEYVRSDFWDLINELDLPEGMV